MTPEEKRARQRVYNQRHKDKVVGSNCPCSRPAVKISRGIKVCQICLDIETWIARREVAKPREVGLTEYPVHLPTKPTAT